MHNRGTVAIGLRWCSAVLLVSGAGCSPAREAPPSVVDDQAVPVADARPVPVTPPSVETPARTSASAATPSPSDGSSEDVEGGGDDAGDEPTVDPGEWEEVPVTARRRACMRLGPPKKGWSLCHVRKTVGPNIDEMMHEETGTFILRGGKGPARKYEYDRVLSEGAVGSLTDNLYETYYRGAVPMLVVHECTHADSRARQPYRVCGVRLPAQAHE